MKKLLDMLLILALMAGCSNQGKNNTLVKLPIPTNSPRITLDYVPDESEREELLNHQNRYSYDTNRYDRNFYTEGNPCIYADYIVVFIGTMTESEIVIEIGGHCNDEGTIGIVFLKKSDLTEFPDIEINERRKAKLYYEFPADFKPVNYLDYVDYATKIEIVE